jgi:hypothetical protein
MVTGMPHRAIMAMVRGNVAFVQFPFLDHIGGFEKIA